MAQSRPWLDEIIDALKDLGGHGTLDDIYARILDRGKMDFTPSWKDGVRGTIYQYSSDSEVYKAGRTDIFYAVSTKGLGRWGIRDFEPDEAHVDITEDDAGFVEGKKKLIQHVVRERNPKVIRLAKQKFKEEHNGQLFCEICKFNFVDFYGEIGEDFIEGHHTIPVSELQEGQKTKVEDIAVVCSNCHRMLHKRRPWLTKEQLQSLISR
ncbi:HNH endonuclease [Paenibacillus sp. Root444D2]|uniref:HNH endonuclease n=1 Tax=Paenibacillus sp. Root444D2 TaxID=1736538 RepID=UPI00070A1C24|nr:HNH endonuclease [Paenibacillus sp. Root444D2]KQX45861.1 restriction endonuclease [Paenibacillus sp. Root444D2]